MLFDQGISNSVQTEATSLNSDYWNQPKMTKAKKIPKEVCGARQSAEGQKSVRGQPLKNMAGAKMEDVSRSSPDVEESDESERSVPSKRRQKGSRDVKREKTSSSSCISDDGGS
uniref:BRD8 n=1 Tax=Caenorhabditis tropicalis TaxID=1561998 RepID=A0A1I7U2V4_9PELO